MERKKYDLKDETLLPEEHKSYLNLDYGIIGKIASTERFQNTSYHFYFWVADGVDSLEISNVVAVLRPDGHITFGVVVELRSSMDIPNFLADYISHDYGDPSVDPPTEVTHVTVAKAMILASTDNKAKPVVDGKVFYASPEGIARALGMEDYVSKGRGIPVGVLENGDGNLTPIYIDEDFLLGPEGAHFNISGISGLATKTSMVEFMLKSILTFYERKDPSRRRRVGIVFFNVKGKDLLFLDKPNPDLWKNDFLGEFSRRVYEVLDIPPEPFHQVRIFAPYDRNSPARVKSLRQDGKVEYFLWELEHIRPYIPRLFDRETWDDNVDAVWADIQDLIDKTPITSYAELVEFLKEERRMMRQAETWHGHDRQVFYKTAQNLIDLPQIYEGIVAFNHDVEPRDVPLEELRTGEFFVVDIQALSERGQKMVFERLLRKLQYLVEVKTATMGLDTVIVFVDELNKFAPVKEFTPIKAAILDATSRGRSMGLIFFGAEQFSSEVDKQVVDNSATICYGRSGHTELANPIYQWLSPEIKEKLVVLPKGTLLLKHAKFTQPIFIKFPYPPCVPGDLYLMTEEELERGRKRKPKEAEWKKEGKVEFNF